MIQVAAWIAIVLLGASYWFQVWKIHKHKEVRDLSVVMYLFLLAGYCALATKAVSDIYFGTGDWLWLARQCITILPVTVILWQIVHHKRDRYHDDLHPHCNNCKAEVEPHWTYCPYCSYFSKEEE